MARRLVSSFKQFIPVKILSSFKPVEYSSASYWQLRYQKEAIRFEWYAAYKDLRRIFTSHISKTSAILNVGNGTSRSYSITSVGNRTACGYVQGRISAHYKHRRCRFRYEENDVEIWKEVSWTYVFAFRFDDLITIVKTMDATKMSFEDHAFDYTIDKATIDSLIVLFVAYDSIIAGWLFCYFVSCIIIIIERQ